MQEPKQLNRHGKMNYDKSQDAHKLSNYDWWKKNHNIITDVEIDLSKLGVSAKKIAELGKGISECLKDNMAFALFTNDGKSVVVFVPETLSSLQGEIKTIYANQKQMFNAIKLVCLTHHNIQKDQKLINGNS